VVISNSAAHSGSQAGVPLEEHQICAAQVHHTMTEVPICWSFGSQAAREAIVNHPTHHGRLPSSIKASPDIVKRWLIKFRQAAAQVGH
jgi:hypothetical protein